MCIHLRASRCTLLWLDQPCHDEVTEVESTGGCNSVSHGEVVRERETMGVYVRSCWHVKQLSPHLPQTNGFGFNMFTLKAWRKASGEAMVAASWVGG